MSGISPVGSPVPTLNTTQSATAYKANIDSDSVSSFRTAMAYSAFPFPTATMKVAVAPGAVFDEITETEIGAYTNCSIVSSTTITVLGDYTGIANGDLIIGVGVPNNTTVSSGGGTGTIVASTAATLTQQSQLMFCRNTGTITAPGSNSRIDRIVGDRFSGAITYVTGTAASSPVAPAIPLGKFPIAKVGPLTSSTTAIASSLITDERNLLAIGRGTWGEKMSTYLSVSTGQSIGLANDGNVYNNTAGVTYTISRSATTLYDGWGVFILASGGIATLTPDSNDSINGGTTGANFVIPAGYFAYVTTDGAGAIRVSLGQGVLGNGTIASATTTDLGTIPQDYVVISGTTTITHLGSTAPIGTRKLVEFSGALTLTNGSPIVLPGSANITTVAGDCAMFQCTASNVWRCLFYQPVSGTSVIAPTVASAPAGSFRNLVVKQTSSTTLSITADQAVLYTASYAAAYTVDNVSCTVNLAATGIGGMDTGSPGTSADLSIYLMCEANGTVGAIATLGSASNGTLYTGANAPSGYIASALCGTVVTNGSAQLNYFYQRDREVYLGTPVVALSSGSNPGSFTSISLAAAVPANGISWGGIAGLPTSSGASAPMALAADSGGTGLKYIDPSNATLSFLGFNNAMSFEDMLIITAQTTYYQSYSSSNPNKVSVVSYKF